MENGELTMIKKFQLRPPMMPNFISIAGLEADLPIEKLTESEANEFSDLMKLAFINHWRKKKSKLK